MWTITECGELERGIQRKMRQADLQTQCGGSQNAFNTNVAKSGKTFHRKQIQNQKPKKYLSKNINYLCDVMSKKYLKNILDVLLSKQIGLNILLGLKLELN